MYRRYSFIDNENSNTAMDDLDRLSRLPVHIIYHIQTLLPMKDAVRSCILSKTWLNLCDSFPVLHTDRNIGTQTGNYDRWFTRLNQTFHRGLYLNLDITELESSEQNLFDINQWSIKLVKQAIHVEELSLVIHGYAERPFYSYDDIPLEILALKGLQSLNLNQCKFKRNPTFDFGYSSLKQMSLTCVGLDGFALENLVLRCPSIEILDFNNCHFTFDKLVFSRFPKLRKIFLTSCNGNLDLIMVNAPNLESFGCTGQNPTGFCLYQGSCVRARIVTFDRIDEALVFKDDVTTCLNEAKLHSIDVSDYDSLKRFHIGMHYHIREISIMLTTSFRIEKFHIVCPSLQSFYFRGDATYSTCREVYIDCPNLKRFTYIRDQIPELVSFNSSTDVKVNMKFLKWRVTNTQSFIHLMKFLHPLRHGEIELDLRIHCTMDQELEALDAFEVSPINVAKLEVHLDNMLPNNGEALVDGLFRIIHPATFTVGSRPYDSHTSSDIFKLLCNKLHYKERWWKYIKYWRKLRTKSSCKGHCNEHWWDHIKDFEVESYSKVAEIKRDVSAIVKGYHRQPYRSMSFKFYWI